MMIGNVPNKNFYDDKKVYARWSFNPNVVLIFTSEKNAIRI